MLATSTEDRPAARPATGPGRADRPHRRIPALDGLRGVAVVGVVLYHAGHLRGGFLGVDLFFVLSGYLITTILLRSWRQERAVDLRRFWSRRARRLLPALLVMLVVVVPLYSHFFALKTELQPVRRDGIASLFYVTNWSQIFSGQSYWAATLAESPLKHVWSLAVEEQFYVLWPLVVVFAARRGGARAVLRVSLGLAAAAATLTILLAATKAASYNSLYLGTHTRAAALLAGAALAAWHRLHGPPKTPAAGRQLEVAALAAAVVLGFMWVTFQVTQPRLYLGGLAVSAVCGVIVVAAAASPTDGPFTKAMSVGPLRFLGTISYGIYLWSWPITQMVSIRHTDFRGWTLVAVQVVLTLAAAIASWVVVERPILRGAIRPPRSGQVLAVAAVVALIAVVTSTAGAVSPTPGTTSTEGYIPATTPNPTKLMVVGDSVPNRITEEGIIPLRNQLGVSVVDRTAPGCILLRSVGEVKGIEGNIRNEVGPCDIGWKRLVQKFKPQVVLLMFGQFPNDQVDLNGRFQLPCTADYRAEEQRELTKAADDLTSAGARLVVATAPGSTVDWVVDRVPPGMNDRVACLNRQYEQLARTHPDVDVVQLDKLVCPSRDSCKDTIDGVNLREDTIHFTGDSAKLVAKWLVPRVLTGKGGAAEAVANPDSPFCTKVAEVQKEISSLVGDADTSEDFARQRDKAVAALRDYDTSPLLAVAPEDIKPDVFLLVGRWNDLLDRAQAVPRVPNAKDLQAVFGDLLDPITRIITFVETNCSG